MHDLANLPQDGRPVYRLGGGNPALIAPLSRIFQAQLRALAADREAFEQNYCVYPSPQGHLGFIHSLVRLLNQQYGWQLTPQHVALTNGSQNAFFMLFNLFGGRRGENQRRILLPQKPHIEQLDERTFKYRINTDALSIDKSIGALCISRPTNPTGNVITDTELDYLDHLASEHDIPLIIDNAYGAPFPNIIHVPATLRWHDNIILSMSLSKLGLPAARTGIIIARPDIIETITEMNAVLNLTPVGATAAMVQPLIDSGEILRLCDEHIRPYYKQRAEQALNWFDAAFAGLPALAHKPEGSIFLWLWFPELPITTNALYERLKQRCVIVVPGSYFFPGLQEDWPHKHQCIRVNVAGDAGEIQTGLTLIADEVRQVMQMAA